MPGKILIIDNDADVLQATQEVLQFQGYDALGFTHTGSVVTLAENFSPDVMLIDYVLDGPTGAELSSQLKQHPQFSHVPVIIMSANRKALQNGVGTHCDAFIEKPFDIWQLNTTIQQLIKQKSLPLAHE